MKSEFQTSGRDQGPHNTEPRIGIGLQINGQNPRIHGIKEAVLINRSRTTHNPIQLNRNRLHIEKCGLWQHAWICNSKYPLAEGPSRLQRPNVNWKPFDLQVQPPETSPPSDIR